MKLQTGNCNLKMVHCVNNTDYDAGISICVRIITQVHPEVNQVSAFFIKIIPHTQSQILIFPSNFGSSFIIQRMPPLLWSKMK